MNRVLIVNADDCNLTAGVTRAILRCHDEGIVTSTSFFINLPLRKSEISEIRKRKKLGVGLHLNVTLGKPVSDAGSVPSLVDKSHFFCKYHELFRKKLLAKHIYKEYEAQVRLFAEIFGCRPTHLDTHHQLHDHPLFYEVIKKLAAVYRLPLRKSRLTLKKKKGSAKSLKVKSTDYLFGSLDPAYYWRREVLETLLDRLPVGSSEIVCHPGWNDKDLKAVSSFTAGRQREANLFSRKQLRCRVQGLGIVLSHHGLC